MPCNNNAPFRQEKPSTDPRGTASLLKGVLPTCRALRQQPLAGPHSPSPCTEPWGLHPCPHRVSVLTLISAWVGDQLCFANCKQTLFSKCLLLYCLCSMVSVLALLGPLPLIKTISLEKAESSHLFSFRSYISAWLYLVEQSIWILADAH